MTDLRDALIEALEEALEKDAAEWGSRFYEERHGKPTDRRYDGTLSLASLADACLAVLDRWTAEEPDMEWSAVTRGPGSGPMFSGGDGDIFPACPKCRGIKPSVEARGTFVEDALGHKPDCPYAGRAE